MEKGGHFVHLNLGRSKLAFGRLKTLFPLCELLKAGLLRASSLDGESGDGMGASFRIRRLEGVEYHPPAKKGRAGSAVRHHTEVPNES